MHLKALFYFIFACNGPHGLAIIKKHLKNLPAFFFKYKRKGCNVATT
jgi:hypothetical protein